MIQLFDAYSGRKAIFERRVTPVERLVDIDAYDLSQPGAAWSGCEGKPTPHFVQRIASRLTPVGHHDV